MRKSPPPRILPGSINQLFRYGLDILLPNGCALCAEHVAARGLCSDCWLGLTHISAPFCARCGRPLAHALPESLCGKCHIKDPILTQVRSVLIYDDVSKGLILPFKHGDRLSLTPLLSQLLRPLFDAMASDGMIIMPVPLHKARYFSCRYNQSAELARNLSASSRHNVHFTPNILLRHRNTRSMGGLTSKKRLQNVSGAFLLKHDSLDALNGKNILLIDDVLTTGATMESCARLLMTRGKAASVSALVLLRVM
jgi:ComF family protein